VQVEFSMPPQSLGSNAWIFWAAFMAALNFLSATLFMHVEPPTLPFEAMIVGVQFSQVGLLAAYLALSPQRFVVRLTVTWLLSLLLIASLVAGSALFVRGAHGTSDLAGREMMLGVLGLVWTAALAGAATALIGIRQSLGIRLIAKDHEPSNTQEELPQWTLADMCYLLVITGLTLALFRGVSPWGEGSGDAQMISQMISLVIAVVFAFGAILAAITLAIVMVMLRLRGPLQIEFKPAHTVGCVLLLGIFTLYALFELHRDPDSIGTITVVAPVCLFGAYTCTIVTALVTLQSTGWQLHWREVREQPMVTK
jgi:hypothetical protein